MSRTRFKIISFFVFISILVSSFDAFAQKVKTGIEVLESQHFEILQGKRVGLVTNPSGVNSQLKSTIDILYENINLVALYAPEHGIRGDISAGKKVESVIDEKTGLPVHSLYGSTRQPTKDMLKGIDIMVYDIQDVGSRSYTFISTLGLVMRTCGSLGIPVVVLDRPNPLGGLKVEGSIIRDNFHSFVGQYKIPYIYGLTVGELAQLINDEGLNCGQDGKQEHIKCELHIIKMQGWKRNMLYQDTKLPWVMPSALIPYPESAIQYPSSGIVGEFSNYLHIGIGYNFPFACFAQEWINADELKAELDSYNIKGVAWRTIHYTPNAGLLKDKLIHGVQYYYTNYEEATITLTQFYIMEAIYKLYGINPFTNSTRIEMINKVCGTDYISTVFASTMKVDSMIDYWNADVENFKNLSKKYYLYY